MYHFVHPTYNAWCIQVWKLATSIYAKSWKTHDIDIDEEFELACNPNKKRAEKKEEKKLSLEQRLSKNRKDGPNLSFCLISQKERIFCRS